MNTQDQTSQMPTALEAQPPMPAAMPQISPQAPVASQIGQIGQMGAVPFHTASLYVGDLHPDVSEAFLYDIFNAVGPVSSIRVCRDAVTRKSLGYAYVNFHTLPDAEKALESMNYTLIKGTPCRIMWSQRDPALRKNGSGNVFVKHLDPSIDNKALYDTFSLFGNILSCKVVSDSNSKSRGYGFVHFETVEAADEAIKKINGMLIAGKEVYVGRFLKRNERPAGKEWTNVYVKNIPKEWDEDKLLDFFGECGAISSSIVMKDDSGVSRGFGFVDFVEHESAVKAVKQYDGYELEPSEDAKSVKEEESDEVKQEGDKSDAEDAAPKKNGLVVCRAQKKTDRERNLVEKFEQLRVEQQSKFQGVNLYVKNLDDKVDDALLRKEFEPFGAITSATVMRHPVGKSKKKEVEPDSDLNVSSEEAALGQSKGFGFVCFSAPEEAVRAVSEMNGKLILGKPIYVAPAQKKEHRRAQLEAQHRQQQRQMHMGMNMPGVGQMGALPAGMPPNMFNAQYASQMGAMYQNSRFAGANPMPTGKPVRPPFPGQAEQGRGPAPGRGNIQFNQQARNLPGGMAPGLQSRGQLPGGMQMQPQQMYGYQLTPEVLSQMSKVERNNVLGERLFPKVNSLQPVFAGKITGMLLEMDNKELLNMLNSQESLILKVDEAVQVLQRAQQQQMMQQ